MSGKNSDRSAGWIPVVAGALMGDDGLWLMHRRPSEKHYGGLWEFPGGKVEDAEIPVKALLRELHEELGITVTQSDCAPVGFAEQREQDSAAPIVIFLYKIMRWVGTPMAQEGGQVGWFTPLQIMRLAKPPLDCELAAGLFEKG
jgi:8-oxo-dGTP diphosphatase